MIGFEKFSLFDNNIIEFYAKKEFIDLGIELPRPSIKFMPEWFKTLPQNRDLKEVPSDVDPYDQFGFFGKTAKACPPLLDAFSLGVTIPFPADIHVRTNEDITSITVHEPFKNHFPLVEEHKEWQVGGRSNFNKMLPHNVKHAKILKFINPWIIKTAPGWSTLFIHPLNNFNLPFTCLSGVVQTDKYFNGVNFPVIWTLQNADIHLYAGTPMITCIPFKRHKHNKKAIIKEMTRKDEIKHKKIFIGVKDLTTSYYKRKIKNQNTNEENS